jgi:hypothetical protein
LKIDASNLTNGMWRRRKKTQSVFGRRLPLIWAMGTPSSCLERKKALNMKRGMQIELTRARTFSSLRRRPPENANKLDVPNAGNTLWSGANAHGADDAAKLTANTARLLCRAAVFAARGNIARFASN